jgi:hypothetical protein
MGARNFVSHGEAVSDGLTGDEIGKKQAANPRKHIENAEQCGKEGRRYVEVSPCAFPKNGLLSY